MKSRHIFTIDRNKGQGAAYVTIWHVTFNESGVPSYREVSQYETASKGATASARKAVKQAERNSK